MGTHLCPVSCPQACSTASPPAADALCTAAAGHETPPGICSRGDKQSVPGAAPGNPTVFKLRGISQSQRGAEGPEDFTEETKKAQKDPWDGSMKTAAYPSQMLSGQQSPLGLTPGDWSDTTSQAGLNRVGEGEGENKPPAKPDLSHTRCHGGRCRNAGQDLARCSLRQGTAPAGHAYPCSPLTFTSFPFISGNSPIFLLSSIRIS